MSKDYKTASYHQPVLLAEVISELNLQTAGVYLDGTAGGGGHSAAILKQLGAGAKLFVCDRDTAALAACAQRFSTELPARANYELIQIDFAHFAQALTNSGLGLACLDGVLLDLGVSSAQLDQAERGFSYMQDGPLDMRMDSSAPLTAAELVNTASAHELERIFRVYGEERYARRLAQAIVRRRSQQALHRSLDLSELIISAMPAAARREKQHPAKRCFQALRIAVNGELEQLESFLRNIPPYMRAGGRLCIISFHSLEDRLVKQCMRQWEQPCTCAKETPYCLCGRLPLGKQLKRKGSTATDSEIATNPRARSARLRTFCFLPEAAALATAAQQIFS